MQLGAVGRAVLVTAAPGLALRMRIESGHAVPRDAAILRPEEALRRRPRIPDAALRRVAGGQPERVVDDAPAAGREGRRLRGLFPVLAAIDGAEDRRAEMPGARRGQQRLAIARVEPRVMHDVSQEMRAGELPRAARRVACQRPQALAGGDQQAHAARGGSRLRHRYFLHFDRQTSVGETAASRYASSSSFCRRGFSLAAHGSCQLP